MFHAGKSLLYSVGYDEKSHECVIIAVEELFTTTGKLPSSIVSNIRNAKSAGKPLIMDLPMVSMLPKGSFRMQKKHIESYRHIITRVKCARIWKYSIFYLAATLKNKSDFETLRKNSDGLEEIRTPDLRHVKATS